MGRLVDLTTKPYNLTQDQIQWVENTIKEMTDEEKIGQLFFNIFFFNKDGKFEAGLSNDEILNKYHIGGARYQGGDSKKVQELLNSLQAKSKIPLFVAANCDAGGNGACSDGTYIASGAQVEATQSEEVAYNAGLVSAREETALGVNMNFDPCVDILMNWRNTIVNTRSYGDNADKVIRYTNAYLKGLTAEREVIQCIKHFPGDGTEERDQHLVLGVNELLPEEWLQSFGKVYKNHIDNGVDMIMAGHIALPKYQKLLNPSLEDKDILPATLSSELITDLLKEKLEFNGLVITDASHMIGMAASMPRRDYVPRAIAAGCDMFLFFNDIEEDFNYMLNGYKNGIITEERLTDALRRILGLKAKIHLPERQANGTLLRTEEDLKVIGCEEHLKLREQSADLGITLVKDTQNNLPISPEKTKKVRIFFLENDAKNGLYEADCKTKNFIKEELERRGFEVSINDGTTREKGSVEKFCEEVDLALIVINIVGYAAENNYRIRWKAPMSSDSPWYIHEVPTIAVSLNYTTHLHDLSMVKTYVNAYHDNEENIRKFIDKLMGVSEFKGIYNELVWTEKWEARR